MAKIDYTARLDISNFPLSHTEEIIKDFCGLRFGLRCGEFGDVREVELDVDENGVFDGRACVDFENEFNC